MSERREVSAPERPTQAPFVQLPCAVIDEIMPTLRDTELRILLVVFRQTVGYRHVDGKHKERDWLSHSQLRQRTGRASEAVSSAVDVLVQRGLLRVHDESGMELVTTQERRNSRGRLYYSLGPLFNSLAPRSLKTEVGKSKITKEALMPICSPFRFSEAYPSSLVTDAAGTEDADRKGGMKQAIRDRLAEFSH